MPETKDIVIVGGGKMGLLHGSLLQATGEARIVGIVDPARSSRFLVRAMGLDVETFATFDEAVAKGRPSACFVCTPPQFHDAVATAAIAKGLDLFVEKPLTVSSEASARLAKEAESAGRVGFVGYVRRHHVVYARMQAEIKKAGGVERLAVRVRSPQFVNADQGSGQKRGGLEWDLLPHATDMALWLAGARTTTEVTAVSPPDWRRIEADLQMAGLPVTLEADWANTTVRKVEMTVDATLRDGRMLHCDEDALTLTKPDGAHERLFHRRDAAAPWFDLAGHEFSEQVRDVLSGFRRRESASATLAEAAQVDAIIATIRTKSGVL